jgi:hypothetical protein
MWAACHNDKEKLMRLVLMQQSAAHFADFCYRGKGLTKDYCLQEFGDYINGRVFRDCDKVEGYTYAMFIDAPMDVEINVDVAQFLWCENVNIAVPQTKCPTLYVSNKSRVNLSCDGYNSVKVYLFDESTLFLDDIPEESDVIIYRYSKKAKVEVGRYCLSHKVREFDKTLRL